MTKDEALKLALEALELHGKQYPHMVKGYCLDAITAIKQALAAPVQEPVAKDWEGAEYWMPLAWELCADECGEDACNDLIWEGGPIPEPWGDRWLKYEDEAKRLIALVQKHTTPPAQEFVCSTGLCHFTLTQTNVGIGERGMEAYEAAKKRGWVGLSDERLMEMPKQEQMAWKNAAIRLGEELSSVGPAGYYDMTAEQWLDWAMTQQPRGKNSLPAAQRQWVGLDWLPEHKCGLHLSHNEHRDVYETVEQFYDADDFISEEEWHKAVAEDSVWVLHWYPNTPVGFTRITASTLEAIEAKLKEKNT